MKVTKSENAKVLCLKGSLDIYEAEPLRQSLLEHLDANLESVIDLQSITAFDTAGAQLLYSAFKTAALGGKTIRFDHVPAAVADGLQRLGLPKESIANRPA